MTLSISWFQDFASSWTKSISARQRTGLEDGLNTRADRGIQLGFSERIESSASARLLEFKPRD
jgi:hypothetical protein